MPGIFLLVKAGVFSWNDVDVEDFSGDISAVVMARTCHLILVDFLLFVAEFVQVKL